MAEKNILAYFNRREDAQHVVPKLQALRAIDVQVDNVERYPGEGVDETYNPLTGNIPGLGYLTSASDISSRNAGVLLAADVSASGMSDGGGGGVTGIDTLLTAVVSEEVYEKAIRVIQEAGGKI